MALDGIQAAKAEWALLSFRATPKGDEELSRAETSTGVQLKGERIYRFQLFRCEGEKSHPSDVRRILVAMKDPAVAYTDLANVLVGREGQSWERHEPPTL